jgi:gliding motility-associated-like protein
MAHKPFTNGAPAIHRELLLFKPPGKHWLRKYDKFGCENFDTLNFKLTASPIIDLGKDTSVICVRAPIKISPGDGFSSYIWEDGSSDKIRFVEITGKYYVTVTDEVGCKASDTMIVKTNPNLLPNKVYIPNAFTPNNDGLNDVFPFDEPVMQTDYNLKVFNRWGEKVYDSDINRQPWDGTTRKDDSQMDAYMWVASYKGCDGNRHTDKGTVTVIR